MICIKCIRLMSGIFDTANYKTEICSSMICFLGLTMPPRSNIINKNEQQRYEMTYKNIALLIQFYFTIILLPYEYSY